MMDIILEHLNHDQDAKIRLCDLITDLDAEYMPPISSITDLSKYSIKLNKFAEVVVAKLAGKDVGFVAFYANDHVHLCAFITSIGVKSELGGHGIGGLLLNRAIKIAIEKGMRLIRLEVNLQNQAAMNFYRKAGFIEVFSVKHKQPHYSALFEKKISFV